jgi:hypothetical protein
MDKKFHQMTEDEQYDNLMERLRAMDVKTHGLPRDTYYVLQYSWDVMKHKRRELVSVIDELTTLMEWQQKSEMEASLND